MIPMDFWWNSTPFFGAAAFSTMKIGDFRRSTSWTLTPLVLLQIKIPLHKYEITKHGIRWWNNNIEWRRGVCNLGGSSDRGHCSGMTGVSVWSHVGHPSGVTKSHPGLEHFWGGGSGILDHLDHCSKLKYVAWITFFLRASTSLAFILSETVEIIGHQPF